MSLIIFLTVMFIVSFVLCGIIFSNTILHKSSKHGFKNIVKIILDLGANVHSKNNRAIELASLNGHADVVKILLEHDADPSVNNNYPLKISSTKLLKEYKELKRSFDIVSKKNEKLIKDNTKTELINKNMSLQEENKTLEAYLVKLKKENQELLNVIAVAEDIINDKKNEENPPKDIQQKTYQKSIGNLDNYEYQHDGKRMCFINIHTGNKVYYDDPLFHELKRRMLSN